REVEEDRTRFEQWQRPTARPRWIDDRRDLAVGVECEELGRELVIGVEINEVRLVEEPRLLEHHRHLHAVRCRQRVELQPLGMLRRPLARDWKMRQSRCAHGSSPFLECWYGPGIPVKCTVTS